MNTSALFTICEHRIKPSMSVFLMIMHSRSGNGARCELRYPHNKVLWHEIKQKSKNLNNFFFCKQHQIHEIPLNK